MTTRRMATTSGAGRAPEPAVEGPASAIGRTIGGVAWILALVAIIFLLNRFGSGPLSTPPLFNRAALQSWLDERDAVTAAFALVRLVGLALAWYLLVATVVGLGARLSRLPRLVRVADLVTVPIVRRALGTIAGVGLTASAASLVAASLLPDRAPAGSGTGAESVIVLERIPDGADVILRRLPEGEDGTSTMRVEEAEDLPVEQPPERRRWEVASGDAFWGMAETALAEAWGRAPTDAEIAPFWSNVVERNRPLLSDSANPDLIFPGQVFEIPAPPPAPAPPAAP